MVVWIWGLFIALSVCPKCVPIPRYFLLLTFTWPLVLEIRLVFMVERWQDLHSITLPRQCIWYTIIINQVSIRWKKSRGDHIIHSGNLQMKDTNYITLYPVTFVDIYPLIHLLSTQLHQMHILSREMDDRCMKER